MKWVKLGAVYVVYKRHRPDIPGNFIFLLNDDTYRQLIHMQQHGWTLDKFDHGHDL